MIIYCFSFLLVHFTNLESQLVASQFFLPLNWTVNLQVYYSLTLHSRNIIFSSSTTNTEKKKKNSSEIFLCFWWWCTKKSSLLNNILLSCKQHTKKLFFLAMYPSVYTLFFHHTNSPLYICTFFFILFFSRKVSRSSLFTPFYTILTLCATATCGGELFFRDVHSKDEKELFTHKNIKKRANIFCPAQVPSFGSLISSPPPPNAMPKSFRVALSLLLLLLLAFFLLSNVRVLREFFVYFSFLCTNFFFVF